MRKIFLLSVIILTICFTNSCSKKNSDAAPPENVQNITATPEYGAVLFSWTFPDDSNYLYVSLSYTDTSGKTVEQKYSRYTDSAVIGGLTNKPYTFTIKAVNNTGSISQSQVIIATPNDPIYQIIAPTLTISSGVGSAIVKWQNTTTETVGIKVTYTDSSGTEQIASDTSSMSSDSLVISGLQDIKTTFSIVLSDVSGAHGSAQNLVTTPLKETRINKSTWSVTADSQETTGETPPNGFATAAIDDNLNTYWHTEWANAQPGYPHWIAVDMHQNVVISRIELTPRQQNPDGFTTFNIDGSNDGLNWTTYASNLNLIRETNTQSFPVTSNPNVRYIRIYATKGASFYANLAELTIYGGVPTN